MYVHSNISVLCIMPCSYVHSIPGHQGEPMQCPYQTYQRTQNQMPVLPQAPGCAIVLLVTDQGTSHFVAGYHRLPVTISNLSTQNFNTCTRAWVCYSTWSRPRGNPSLHHLASTANAVRCLDLTQRVVSVDVLETRTSVSKIQRENQLIKEDWYLNIPGYFLIPGLKVDSVLGGEVAIFFIFCA